MTARSRPVFIGGAGRSGTTLLVDMLGLHPHLSPIYETDFVIDLLHILLARPQLDPSKVGPKVMAAMDRWTKPLPHRPHNKREHERYHHGVHHILFDRPFAMRQTEIFIAELAHGNLLANFRGLIDALFTEHCRLDGKPRWINKTPIYVSLLPALRTFFPDLKFIHCLRDGRDVACSVMTRAWGPDNPADAAVWWQEIVERGQQFGAEWPDQYRDVRYEDLVTDPATALGRIFDWLGEDRAEDEVVSRYASGEIQLDPARLYGWRESLSSDDQAAFRETAGPLLEKLGYEV